MTSPPRVLVLDGIPPVRALLREVLEEAGYRASAPADSWADPGAVARPSPDLVVLDPAAADGPRSEVLARAVRAAGAAEIAHVCTGATDVLRSAEDDLARRGIGDVAKPFDLDDLLRAAGEALARRPGRGSGGRAGGAAGGGAPFTTVDQSSPHRSPSVTGSFTASA